MGSSWVRRRRVSYSSHATTRVKHPGKGQGGFALAEVLAALLVLAVGISAVFSSLLAVFMSSQVNRDKVLSGIEATQVVESVQRSAYVPCAGTSSYNSSMPVTSGMTLAVSDVKYLASSVSDSASFQNTCPPSGDKGVQRITVTARPTARPNRVESIVIFKRNDTCPGSPTTGERC